MAIVRRIPETVGPRAVQWSLNGGQRFERTTTHHRLSIGLGSKRFRFEFERVHQGFATSAPHYAAQGRAEGASHWSSMALVGVMVLSLFLAFAQMFPARTLATRYSAVIAIPKKSVAVAAAQQSHPRRIVRPSPAAPHEPQADAPALALEPAAATDLPNDVAEGEVTTITSYVDPDVEALPAGNGERAVAVWGARREVNGKSCRDVQVFTRGVDGAISVKPGVKCDTGRGRTRE